VYKTALKLLFHEFAGLLTRGSFRDITRFIFSTSRWPWSPLCVPCASKRPVGIVLPDYVSLKHPGGRPTNGIRQKMGRFLWEELEVVCDFGRFQVQKRPSFSNIFELLDERASSTRVSHAMASREERLPGLTTSAVTVNETPTRDFAHFLHFQLAIGALSRSAAELRETSLRGRVHGDRSSASGFESVLSISGILSTA